MSDDFLDFEIHVHRDGLLTITVEPGDRRVAVNLPESGPLEDAELVQALDALAYGRLDDERSRQLGSRLFEWLFSADAASLYRSVQSTGQPIRYRFIIEPPHLAAIAWELIYDPVREVFLALDGPFVRGLTIMEPASPLEADLPLRILLVDAIPLGSDVLRVDEERSAIREAFGDLGKKAEVRSLPHASLASIENALREARASGHPFHVLHFMGHGRHDPKTGKGNLLLEDRWGRSTLVDAAAFAEILRPHGLRLVFLNACETADVSPVEITDAFAPVLLRLGIPAVIGMQTSVLDDVARQFAQDFYESLVDNRPVDAALADARRLARGTDPGRPASLGIPVAYLRSRSGQIAQLVESGDGVPWWRRVGIVAAGAIGLIASVIAIWQFAIPLIVGPPQMTGDINVAVARFGAVDTEGRRINSQEAFSISEQVFTRLQTELVTALSEEGFIIQVRGPDEIGVVQGGTPEQRAERASRISRDLMADVVVYGNYVVGPGVQEFQPEFYLSGRTLLGADELAGQYQLGRAESFNPDNAVERLNFRERIEARTRALSQFVVGLSYHALFQYDDAREWFQAAYDTPGWDERDGKEILLLFLGWTASIAGDYETAGAHFAEALRLNPDYSRAHYGAADIAFHLGRNGDCPEGDIDIEAMARSIAAFERARTSSFRPPLADVEAQVDFGLGRVYLCQFMAGMAVSGDVEAPFRQVIDEFEDGNTRLTELASESWANLGLYHLRQGRTEEALDGYSQAIGLAPDLKRRGILECVLGEVYLGLGRYDEAVTQLEAGLSHLEDDSLHPVCESNLEHARDEAA